MDIFLVDESATYALGAKIAQICPPQLFSIYLEGELGVGKTSLSRALIQTLGHEGKVKSPTYTMVERYELSLRTVFHFDLYHLADPEELDYLGLDDYFSQQSLCLVEWAINGKSYLPKPDLVIHLAYKDSSRIATITPHSILGTSCYSNLS